MSFTVPTFNLNVNIWRNGNPRTNPPDVTAMGNLAWGRRVSYAAGLASAGPFILLTLLLPVGTDVRSSVTGAGSDLVEVPAGSGRFYDVNDVDDIGKGFTNEHRAAVLTQNSVVPWPAPIP